MKIAVIDGQGGRIGGLVIEALRKAGVCEPHTILALGTNAIATGTMLKAGADQGATGTNPVIVAARNADIIIGPIGILMADALLGEITPEMAMAVGRSDAEKILLPSNKCNTTVVGTQSVSIAQAVSEVASITLKILNR